MHTSTAPGTPHVRLSTIARGQFAVFTRSQAVAEGVATSTIDRHLRTGRWRSLLPGVMVEAGVPESWGTRAMAVVLAVGGEVVLARQSAARLHALDLPPGVPGDLAVLVRSRTFPTMPEGIRVHRTRRLPDEHVDRSSVLPRTTPARTICDLAGQIGPQALRRCVADAVRRGVTDAVGLRSTVGALGRIRGKRNLLHVCAELSPLEADCRSELEARFVRLMTRMGMPPTAMNHAIVDVDGRRRVIDAIYLPQRIPIELDSRSHHGTLLDRGDDLARENAITLTGWRSFLRFTWWDLRDRPCEVVSTIRTALAAADHDRFA